MKIEKFHFNKEKNYKIPKSFTDLSYDNYIHAGVDNKLPYQNAQYYLKSGSLQSIINKRTNMSIAGDINIDTEDVKIKDKTEKFLNNINPYYDFKMLSIKIFNDLYLQGGAYVKIHWNKTGTKILEIYHIPAEVMRNTKPNSMNIIDVFLHYIGTAEIDINTRLEDFIQLPSFNTNDNKNKAQIYHIQKPNPLNIFYDVPDWIGVQVDFDNEIEIKNMNNSGIYNGLNPGLIVMIDGNIPSDEVQNQLYDDLEEFHVGSDNNQNFMLMYKKGMTPEFQTIDNPDWHKKFESIEKTTQNNIVTGTQIPRSLLSMESNGALSISKELKEASETFQNQYIIPHQNILLSFINKMLYINKLAPIEYINPKYNVNISSENNSDLLLIFSVEEIQKIKYAYSPNKLEDIEIDEDIEEIEKDSEEIEEDSEEIEEDKLNEKKSLLKKIKDKIWRK